MIYNVYFKDDKNKLQHWQTPDNVDLPTEDWIFNFQHGYDAVGAIMICLQGGKK